MQHHIIINKRHIALCYTYIDKKYYQTASTFTYYISRNNHSSINFQALLLKALFSAKYLQLEGHARCKHIWHLSASRAFSVRILRCFFKSSLSSSLTPRNHIAKAIPTYRPTIRSNAARTIERSRFRCSTRDIHNRHALLLSIPSQNFSAASAV